jgi:dihydrofolate synthase/folylpolyglutamate synthase
VADAFLALGSNLGDRAANLAEAVRRLSASPQIRVVAASSLYESAAVGYTAQPDFLNAVVRIATPCAPHELLALCLRIESELGRVRRERWGPRPIDIDVLLYDEVVLDEPALTIPHPRMRERNFVLTPLAEIAPTLTLGGEPIVALAARLDASGLRKVGTLPVRGGADYEATKAYLISLKKRGVSLGLGRMERFMAALDHPERKVPCVHVAGTNGKGSVAAMLETILRAAGWRTGLYTSPHLVKLGERVQVDRRILSESEIVGYTRELRPLAARVGGGDPRRDEHPSYFEFMTAMAFVHFARAACDIAIVEVGLGGRLDATNVVVPAVSVITSIGLDHCEILGHSLEQIAREKAGIIKPGVPVVIGRLPPVAEQVIRSVAAECGAPVLSVAQEFGDALERYPRTNLEGDYQRRNAATALLVARMLGSRWRLDDEVVACALQKVSWPGRWQRTRVGGRLLILDASHNPEGAQMLDANLARLAAETGRASVVIMGVLGASRAQPLIETVCRHATEIHFIVPHQARACTHAELEALVPASFRGRIVRARVEELFPAPKTCTAGGPEDAIVVTGSIYLLGEVLSRLDPTRGTLEDALQDF